MTKDGIGMQHVSALHELDDAIHSMAQPLTALLFAVEMVYMQSPTEQIREALVSARTEARRTADALEQVRESAGRVREEVMACRHR
jgi:hypothetical protein